MECLEQCRARYGERFIIYPVGMRPVVFLSAPDEIRAVATAPPTSCTQARAGI